jgi:hypothetical protein
MSMPEAVERPMASQTSTSDSETVKPHVFTSLLSPEKTRRAVFEGQNDFIFNQYQDVTLRVEDAASSKSLATYAVPLQIQKDYEFRDDAIWWENETSLFITGLQGEGSTQQSVVQHYAVDTGKTEVRYVLPEGVSKLAGSKTDLYFFVQNQLKHVDLEKASQDTLMTFESTPVALSTTTDSQFLVIGLEAQDTFLITRTPPAPRSYYRVNIQSKAFTPCFWENFSAIEESEALAAEMPRCFS